MKGRWRLSSFGLLGGLFCGLLGCEPTQTAYRWPLPDGFPRPEVPAENPMTAAKVELGRHLFYDVRLSANQQQSCSSCHQQAQAFAEPKVVSIGSTGEAHRRNALALVNVAYNRTLTWAHPQLQQIEQQLLLPMLGDNPVELGMAGQQATILARLKTPPYPALFDAAFGSPEPDMTAINLALASFVRRLISLQSPFDQYAYQHDDSALTAAQIRGMDLFFSERFECHHCHGGFNFTQSTSHEKQPLDRRPFHNTGLYYTQRAGLSQGKAMADLGYPQVDRGLAELSGRAEDDGRFRAPTLRNIAVTAPYMHDGSVATLSEVIDLYRAGGRVITDGPSVGDGRQHPSRSPFVKGIAMTDAEKQDLLAFLQSLTDPHFLTDPALANPWPDASRP